MPLGWAIFATSMIGLGVGTVFPIATVSIQNAVDRHDVGTATGTMNFFARLGAHSPLRSWGRSCSPALASRRARRRCSRGCGRECGCRGRCQRVPVRVRAALVASVLTVIALS